MGNKSHIHKKIKKNTWKRETRMKTTLKNKTKKENPTEKEKKRKTLFFTHITLASMVSPSSHQVAPPHNHTNSSIAGK